MNCMLEIENKIRGYVSGMELSRGGGAGNRTRLLQGLESGWGMGTREEIQQWLKMVPGGVCSNT